MAEGQGYSGERMRQTSAEAGRHRQRNIRGERLSVPIFSLELDFWH